MASSLASCTAGPTTPSPLLRRSFTLPSRLVNIQEPQSFQNNVDKDANETLFVHPSTKFVVFSPSDSYTRSHTNSHARLDQEGSPIAELPFESHAERTLAAGSYPFLLLRPFSVSRSGNNNAAFLNFNSGRLVHPILPKTQCWCVDGETKFAIKIRENHYYRIELPNTSPEDQRTADELKEVFSKVLQYERTACPFKRGFTVDLPESPKTPTQYRPWTPRTRPSPRTEILSNDKSDQSEADKPTGVVGLGNISEENTDDEEDRAVLEKAILKMADSKDLDDAFDTVNTPTRPKGLNGSRSVTAPPQLILKTIPPSSTTDLLSRTASQDSDTASVASSVESFYSLRSFHSPVSPLPPSPPYSNPPSPPQRIDFDLGIDVARSRQHKRDVSELTVTAESFGFSDASSTPTWPQTDGPSTPLDPVTPGLTNDGASQSDELWPEVATPSPRTALRRRRRALSPLPPPGNLYFPKARLSGQHLTAAILRKTCALLLGPPIQLVALMLNLAQRIARGAFYTSSVTIGERGQVVPGTWAQSDAENEHDQVWAVDDYGISLRELLPRTSRSRNAEESKDRDGSGSWEID
ncbi:hypothetical protein MMC26_007025 [Xylographa opegraphella]|nr:hypothetical protein [Xylographa opegraphella]